MRFYAVGSIVLVYLLCPTVCFRLQDNELTDKYGNITFAAVLIRPFHHAPPASYPKDPYKDFPWEQGFGRLTKKGEWVIYGNGVWLKKRYEWLLSDQYIRLEISTNSSALDTTVMSAQLFLFGMYPATNSSECLRGESWQPIPVFTVPYHEDNLLEMSKPCPRLGELLQAIFNRSDMQQLFADLHLPFIAENSGLNVTSVPRDFELYKILGTLRNTIMIERMYSLDQPGWIDNQSPNIEQRIKDFESEARKIYYSYAEVNKLFSGTFLKSVFAELVYKVDHPNSKRKVHLYSGTDTIMEAALAGVNSTPTLFTTHEVNLCFELRKKNDDYVVVVSLNMSYDSEPNLVKIPGCSDVGVCTLEELRNIIQQIAPSDNWETECQVLAEVSIIN